MKYLPTGTVPHNRMPVIGIEVQHPVPTLEKILSKAFKPPANAQNGDGCALATSLCLRRRRFAADSQDAALNAASAGRRNPSAPADCGVGRISLSLSSSHPELGIVQDRLGRFPAPPDARVWFECRSPSRPKSSALQPSSTGFLILSVLFDLTDSHVLREAISAKQVEADLGRALAQSLNKREPFQWATLGRMSFQVHSDQLTTITAKDPSLILPSTGVTLQAG